ncbi:hypothetical protein [Phascolarctobacterium sp.]
METVKEIIKAFCDRYFNYRDRDFFRIGFIFGLVIGVLLGFVLKAVVF